MARPYHARTARNRAGGRTSFSLAVNECLCKVHSKRWETTVCVCMRARASDGYSDISSHVQSHNVTRNTRAHQSFSRKWNLLPSSCSVSAPCTSRCFVRPSALYVCMSAVIRRAERVRARARERERDKGQRNELPPNQKCPFQIRKTALDAPAAMLIDGCKGGISITIKSVYEPINVAPPPPHGLISINRD